MNQSFYVGAMGAGSSTEKMSVIANNLANVNSIGFKPKTAVFSGMIEYNLNDAPGAATDLKAGSGMRVQRTQTSFDPSGVLQTDSPFDYAILEPNAFFMLQDPVTNQISYTRNGHFYRAERDDGYCLMSESGKLVLDQNQEPIPLEVTDIDQLNAEMEEGYEPDVEEYEEEDWEEQDQPRVSLYTFENPSRLLSAGGFEYIPSGDGMEPQLVENPALICGGLESSGTDVAKEMVRMMECQRAFTYALRMVAASDEIEGTINSLRG